MLKIKAILIFICAIIINCKSAYLLKNKNKCSINENECQRDLYNNIIQDLSVTGLPDAGIPTFDPFEIKDFEVVVMGMVKLTMPEGIVNGFKTCRCVNLRTDVESQMLFLELKCETFAIDTKYNLQTTPILDALIGGIKVHGNGHGSLELENLLVKLEIPFVIKKLQDSELHVILIPENITSSVEDMGKFSVAGDNLFVGSQEISSVVVNIVNENWKFFVKTFEKAFFDAFFGVAIDYINKFFAAVPIKDLITDDLTAYVTN